jgi:prepilin-type N-terminal cleavage/methylation domain-containing protein
MTASPQRGFTLLEIVIVILVVGFLLAGALKGQELITSAKVKRIAGQLDEVRTAYFAFQDRFKALPGDYASAAANLNCGTAVCLHGNGDGRITNNAMVVDGNEPHEELLLWSHLSTSGFLKGNYVMTAGESQPTDRNAPKNSYTVYLEIAFDGNYGVNGVGTPRHNLKTGAQIPVSVLMELDRKIDDGKPYKGGLQFSPYSGNALGSPQEGGASGCTTAADLEADWNFLGGNTNCGAALLF